MYRIIWNENGYGMDSPVYRNTPNPSDQRPTSVDADRYEVSINDNPNIYVNTVTFYREDQQVLTLFQLPVAVENVAILPQ